MTATRVPEVMQFDWAKHVVQQMTEEDPTEKENILNIYNIFKAFGFQNVFGRQVPNPKEFIRAANCNIFDVFGQEITET